MACSLACWALPDNSVGQLFFTDRNNSCTDLLILKFCRAVSACNSTTTRTWTKVSSVESSWPVDVQEHEHSPVWSVQAFSSKFQISCGPCNFTSTGRISPMRIFMTPACPIEVQWHGQWPVGPLGHFCRAPKFLRTLLLSNRCTDSIHPKFYKIFFAHRFSVVCIPDQ